MYKHPTRLLLVLIILLSCNTDRRQASWQVYLENIGTYSSPRVADLNGDDIPDVLLGSGGREERHSDTAVVAIDGRSGKLLWTLPGSNQFVGSAVFLDV